MAIKKLTTETLRQISDRIINGESQIKISKELDINNSVISKGLNKYWIDNNIVVDYISSNKIPTKIWEEWDKTTKQLRKVGAKRLAKIMIMEGK